MRSSGIFPPPMTILLSNRRTRYPCPRSQASRAASCCFWSPLSCGGPSSSTMSRCSTQRKSTTYFPIGTWRRNFSASSEEPRKERQRIPSATVILRRSLRAKAIRDFETRADMVRALIRPGFAGPPSPASGRRVSPAFRACLYAAIALAFSISASAMRIEAMSIRRPSRETAPLPSLAAWLIASRMRRAFVTSASDGVKT